MTAFYAAPDVPLAPRAAPDRGDLLDGRAALSAAAIRLSRRYCGRLRTVGNVQDHGAAAAPLHHGAGDGRDLDLRHRPCPAGALVYRRLVSGEVRAGAGDDHHARADERLGERLPLRPQP